MKGDYKQIHGYNGNQQWPLPILAAKSDQANRKDQGNQTLANEWLDSQEVLREKMKVVAILIKQSKHCIAYTGAGLSRASGIPDYATKAANSISTTKKITSNYAAEPTYSHRVLTAIEKAGFLKHYVQQNHDGLPQKSGFPQHKMNEIHGAWWDPSNPVVKFSGSLRGDLCEWMEQEEQKADLCLCLGTSLSGMNADRMAVTPAEKMLKQKALGTVIINLQQTSLDDKCAIRVWGVLDDAMKILAEELQLVIDPTSLAPKLDAKFDNKFLIPYDENGLLSKTKKMYLNLKPGQQIKIAPKEASNYKKLGTIVKQTEKGDYLVKLDGKESNNHFGRWWVLEALQGLVPSIPIVNVNPEFEKDVQVEQKVQAKVVQAPKVQKK